MGFKKGFADAIKVLEIPVENLGDGRSYALLYVKYASMYTYITAYVCYFCVTVLVFEVMDYLLSVWYLISFHVSLFPRYESVAYYRAL